MGFFAMIASLLLGIFFVIIGISRRKQKRLAYPLDCVGNRMRSDCRLFGMA